MKNTINTIIRFINSLQRPSKKVNRLKMQKRGETVDSFTIREATTADIPALATLHVKTWSETYKSKSPPDFRIREYQWRKAFDEYDGKWFCLVIENREGHLIGFTKAIRHKQADQPGSTGEINKIYLLKEYQRIGLGQILFCNVVRRFLSEGINSMFLFGIPQNPSCAFHKAMGGEKMISKKGTFDGGYRWSDLQKLTTICLVHKV